MDIPIDSKTIKKRKLRGFAKWLLFIVVATGTLFLLRSIITPKLNLQDIRTAFVESGEVSTGLSASGVVVPKNTRVLTSPIGSSIQEVYKILGSSVHVGDPILRIDSTMIDLEITRLEDELSLKELEIIGLGQDQQQKLRELINQEELLAIELESQEVQFERYETLSRSNVVSKNDMELLAVQVRKAEIELRQIGQQIADQEISGINQLQQLELQGQLLRQKYREQERLKEETTIRAIVNGTITALSDQLGQNIIAGEQLARISDLTSFRIDVTISDYYLQQISAGMPVNINLGSRLTSGYLSQILPSIEDGTIQVQVELNEPSLEQLKPNLRAEVEILTQYRESSLRVNNGVAFNGTGIQEVFVIQGTMAIKKKIEIGMNNSRYVEVINGVQLGDEIIISDMTSFEHLEEIFIN